MAASEGVDLEWAIVEHLNARQNKTLKFSREYSSKIKQQAEKCVDHIVKFAAGKNIEAWHSDDSKNPTGHAISAKPEPKTDIVLKIGNSIYYTSVKMEGGVQLASGQGASTAELFEAAASYIKGGNKSKILLSIIDQLKTLPTRLLADSNVARIEKEGKQKVIDEFLKNGKVVTDKSYDFWLKNNKQVLMHSLLEYVDEDEEFKAALLFESLTGKKSLAQYDGASADSIISPKGFFIVNDNYVRSIFSKVKFDIRGKSRGGITGVAFRIDLKG